MPKPVSKSAIYLPGLDGLRAIAVVAVVGYHLEISWLSGGLLGVGMFFTLSGFLITMILLRTWQRTGGLDLKTFWLRRARRLLPAVILVLLVVLVATMIVEPGVLVTRWWESVAAMFYISNWTAIAADVSYFDRFGGPGALDHLWSLAVEEQFYLVWPLVLLAMLKGFKGRLSRVAVVTLVLAALSFVLMAVLAEPGFDNTRAYEGTDTRAGGVLIGAAVAMIWQPQLLTADVSSRARLIIDGIGVASLLVIGWLFVVTNPFSMSLYRGGILLLSIATVLVVAVVVHPASRLRRVMALAPLVWIGERSYGIYLWHLPIMAFTPASVLVGSPFLRGAMQVAVTIGLAQLSWVLLEDPIRRHGVRGALAVGTSKLTLPPSWGRRRVPALVSGTLAVAALGVLALVVPPIIGGTVRQPVAEAAGPLEPPVPTAVATSPTESATGSAASPTPAPTLTPTPTPTSTPTATASVAPTAAASTPAAASGTLEAACDGVVVIGDSTSVGLVSDDYLPDESAQIGPQLARVGAEPFIDEIDGAQSIIETFEGHANAQERVDRRLAEGFDGCWIFALGTNDAANQAAGAGHPSQERIDLLMDRVGDNPVMWLTVKSTRTSGPYADGEMQAWSESLVEACDRHPNMRVYDWRAEMVDDWFISDGIHFTTPGYVERSRRIADALATSFPVSGSSPDSCLVRTDA